MLSKIKLLRTCKPLCASSKQLGGVPAIRHYATASESGRRSIRAAYLTSTAVSFGLNEEQRAIQGSDSPDTVNLKLTKQDLAKNFARDQIVPVAAEYDRTMVSRQSMSMSLTRSGVPLAPHQGGTRRWSSQHSYPGGRG